MSIVAPHGTAPSACTARTVWVVVLLGVWAAGAVSAGAQQKIGYIDSEYILNKMPEYATVQQKLDQIEEKWRKEIQAKKEEVDNLRQKYQARELLYTEEERAEMRDAINKAQKEVESLRQRYFGPNGELYAQQKQLMRPIQERVLAAAEEVATARGYDYVFDKSGDFLFMYTREQYNLSDAVLRELGINVERQQQSGR